MSTLKVNPVMYLIAETGNPMSAGKFAAQAGHAAVEAYKLSPNDRLKHIWDECGHQYAKVVLQTDNLFMTNLYLVERGYVVVPIIDEGRTEFTGDLTLTFLGVQILDKNRADVQATFRGFKLYKDPRFATLQDAINRQQELHPRKAKSSFTARCKERLRGHRSGRTA